MDILIAISDANRTMEVDSRLIEQPLVESATIFIDTDGLSISDPQVVEVLEVNNAMNETAPSSVLTHSTGISGDAGLRESLVGSSLTNSNSNSTSISSLTVSPPSLLHVDDFPTSYGPTRHGKHDTENKKGKTSPHKKPAGEMSLDKKLSFRTDSTGSMGSLVSGLDLSVSTIVEEHSDEDEESVESPVKSKFNQNNISSASILVSALKQKKQMRKKSVSFSIPSADDISRRAKKTSKLPLMYSTNDFDDNLADYQIISPKASSNERTIKPRTFSSPTRSGKYSNAIEITQLGDTVGIATHSPTASGREFFSTSPDLPPRPGHSRDSSPSGSPAAAAAATGGTQQEEHTAASRQHIHLRSLAIANQYSQSQQKGKGAGGQHPQNGVYGSVESPTAPSPPPPPPSLMQRICEARNPQELCQVFGISSESVFTGGKLCKCRLVIMYK